MDLPRPVQVPSADRLNARRARVHRRRIVERAEWDAKTRASVCAVCGSPVDVVGHHVLPLRFLKVEKVPRELWFDPRNNLPLCDEKSPERCHTRHELHVRRVPRDVVLAGAPFSLEFAREVGLEHVFDREYPTQEAT
jgi:hypothetical protein